MHAIIKLCMLYIEYRMHTVHSMQTVCMNFHAKWAVYSRVYCEYCSYLTMLATSFTLWICFIIETHAFLTTWEVYETLLFIPAVFFDTTASDSPPPPNDLLGLLLVYYSSTTSAELTPRLSFQTLNPAALSVSLSRKDHM